MKISAFVCAFAIGAASGPGLAQSADSEPKDIRNFTGAEAPEDFNGMIVEISGANAPATIEQDYEPSPAIWKLADEDTTIWLFGTFHLLPEGFRWRSSRFDEIVASADELVVETSDKDLELDDDAIMALIFEKIRERQPTSAQLSAESAEKWQKLMESSREPVAVIDAMPPFFSLIALGVEISGAYGSTHDNGVETVLEAEFAAAGKPVGSIEDAMTVMRNLLSVDDKLMIAWLEEQLANWDGENVEEFVEFENEQGGENSVSFDAEHQWAQGLASDEPMFDDSPLEQLLHQILLEDRNRGWSIWLKDRLERPGNVLVAVGAGHFEEPDSLLTMLKQDGMTVQRTQ